MANHTAEYHKEWRRRRDEKKLADELRLQEIILGHKPATTDLLPLVYLYKLMNDETAHPDRRIKAAQILAPYFHEKVGTVPELGKKSRQQRAADEASNGRYAPGAEPIKLVFNSDDKEAS